MRHRKTDPACSQSRFYQWTSNRLGYWWCNRNRGRSCRPCMEARRVEFGSLACKVKHDCLLVDGHERPCLVLR